MKVLVTGGSGLVGKYITADLAESHHVEILDLKKPHREDFGFHPVDLLDYPAVERALPDCDVVVHLAGIPHPLSDPAGRVFRTNVMATFNILEACADRGIRRFIFLSSESTLGLAFSSSVMWPLYIPIDEQHPVRPEDPYGLSKLVGELLCKSYAQRYGIQTICLRPPWIWVPEAEEIRRYRDLIAEYSKWSKNLWAYIHVADVANAIRCCIESAELPVHDCYFITAAETWTEVESRSLVSKYFPRTTTIAADFSGRDSLISWKKAHEAFAFTPQHTWREIVRS